VKKTLDHNLSGSFRSEYGDYLMRPNSFFEKNFFAAMFRKYSVAACSKNLSIRGLIFDQIQKLL